MYDRAWFHKFFACVLALAHVSLYAGVTPETLVYSDNCIKSAHNLYIKDIIVGQDEHGKTTFAHVTHITPYVTNQLYRLITATSTLYIDAQQEFFVYNYDDWMPTSQLRIDDLLLRSNGSCTPIREIQHIPGEHRVYAITVDNTHTFYVSYEHILAHNECATASTLAMGSLSETPVVLAHPAVAGGVAIGVLGYELYAFFKERKNKNKANNHPEERVTQNTAAAGGAGDPDGPHRPNNSNDANKHNNYSHDPCPEKRDNGAQAPGKPLRADGFIPPKNWDGKKVKHPITGQYGWKDAKGNIWVPTGPGPLAHGGPHWDVIDEDGNCTNILPGGMIR